MSEKGKRGGLCNRTVCQKPLKNEEQFYNTSTRAWYCGGCADKINYWSLNDDNEIICISEDKYDNHQEKGGREKV